MFHIKPTIFFFYIFLSIIIQPMLTKPISIVTLSNYSELVPFVSKDFAKYELKIIDNTLISHHIKWLSQYSKKIIVFVTYRLFKRLPKFEIDIPIDIIPLSKHPGTTRILQQYKHLIDTETFIISKADTLIFTPLDIIFKKYLNSSTKIFTIIKENKSENIFGYFDHKIYYMNLHSNDVNLKNISNVDVIKITNNFELSNVYICDRSVLDKLQLSFSSFLYDFLPFYIKKWPVGFIVANTSIKIDKADDYYQACYFIKERIYLPVFDKSENNKTSWYNKNKIIQNRIVVKGGNRYENIVGAEFFGDDFESVNSIIGDNCYIERGAVIKNAVIMDNVKIGMNVYIENSIIGNNVIIPMNCNIKNSKIDHNYVISKIIVINNMTLYEEKKENNKNNE